ncbi:daptide biosynthesis RiPP recognition protein [Streptomyces griseoruber]|uniref:Uncharacterized protein n=1 Tax=Streptomyces griseoruber TaxID=1943 RepID=A0A101T2J1_9ACTN|nr:daptide biosynthesis RiPP recognition protein [Streptomyces griseoruber]KUN84529.1 hypothetical protein AQJ64_13520 [Streptomyces griseoruber]
MSVLKERLMSWATGRTTVSQNAGHAARTVVLEDAAHLAALLASDAVDADTMIFVPGVEGSAGSADSPTVIGYEGSLAEPGTEFTHDPGFYLQIQAYGISEYMSVVGPTLVRVADATDFESYLLDADRAHDQGMFADSHQPRHPARGPARARGRPERGRARTAAVRGALGTGVDLPGRQPSRQDVHDGDRDHHRVDRRSGDPRPPRPGRGAGWQHGT